MYAGPGLGRRRYHRRVPPECPGLERERESRNTDIALKLSPGPAIIHSISSTSLGRHSLVRNGSSGLQRRRIKNQPFFGAICIQLPSLTPWGLVGAKYTVVAPSAPASAAGVG
jgi:hypothetical protein